MKQMIHYINNGKGGIYGKDVFVKEAKAIGVNRAFPHFIAKKIKFGDRIYVAIYEKDPSKPNKEKWVAGTANIFGYFVVDSINIVGDLSKVYLNLGLVPQKGGTQVVRSCGTYTVAYTCPVNQPIDKIIEECQRENIEYKLMLGGKFYDYSKTITPINFSRSIVTADIPEDYAQAIDTCINELRQLENYVRV